VRDVGRVDDRDPVDVEPPRNVVQSRACGTASGVSCQRRHTSEVPLATPRARYWPGMTTRSARRRSRRQQRDGAPPPAIELADAAGRVAMRMRDRRGPPAERARLAREISRHVDQDRWLRRSRPSSWCDERPPRRPPAARCRETARSLRFGTGLVQLETRPASRLLREHMSMRAGMRARHQKCLGATDMMGELGVPRWSRSSARR
jgi:hypothetical protein